MFYLIFSPLLLSHRRTHQIFICSAPETCSQKLQDKFAVFGCCTEAVSSYLLRAAWPALCSLVALYSFCGLLIRLPQQIWHFCDSLHGEFYGCLRHIVGGQGRIMRVVQRGHIEGVFVVITLISPSHSLHREKQL